MNAIIKELDICGVLPYATITDVQKGIQLAQTLVEEGICCLHAIAEADVIQGIVEAVPNIMLGAGAAQSAEQVESVMQAGAKFLIREAFSDDVLKYCDEKGYSAVTTNFTTTISSRYSGDTAEIVFYSISKDDLQNDDFNKIAFEVTEKMKEMLNFKMGYFGMNAQDETEAKATANIFKDLFNFELQDNKSAVFLDDIIEIVKSPVLGHLGRIAIKTSSVERAVRYLQNRGGSFNEETRKIKEDKLVAIYLEDFISGYAIRLIQE